VIRGRITAACQHPVNVCGQRTRYPRVAMQILHSKIALTMEIYTEVPSASTHAALKKLGRWLGK